MPSGAEHDVGTRSYFSVVLRLESWGKDRKKYWGPGHGVIQDNSACVVVYALHSPPRVPWNWGMKFDHKKANGVDGTKYEGKQGEKFREWKVPTRCTISLTPVLDILKSHSKQKYRIGNHSCQTLITDLLQSLDGSLHYRESLPESSTSIGDCVEKGPKSLTKVANWKWMAKLFAKREDGCVEVVFGPPIKKKPNWGWMAKLFDKHEGRIRMCMK